MKILFITSVTQNNSHRNLNHFQRVYFLSRHAELKILAPKGSDFAVSANPGTEVVHAPWPGKLGVLVYTVYLLLRGTIHGHDIVLTEPSILGIAGYICRLFSRARWVVDIWDIPIRGTQQNGGWSYLRHRLTRHIMRALYKRADLFVISILPDFELKYFRLPAEKTLALRNAIWPDEESAEALPASDNKFNILCMRSVHTSDMGLDVLSAAFQNLENEIDNLSLTIIGRIPEHVKPQVARLEGKHNVAFIDFVEQHELKRLIKSASICVVPFKDVADLSQTYPVKVLEYMSLGTPVIASDIAGMSQLIEDEVTGLLFRAGDSMDLAAKIERLHVDEDLYASLCGNARRMSSRFDCRQKNLMIIDRLRRLVQEPLPPRQTS